MQPPFGAVKHDLGASIVLGTAILTGGCVCYKVVDTTSGRVYYTNNVSTLGGAATFKDMNTGDIVRLPSYQINDVDCEEARAGGRDPERE